MAAVPPSSSFPSQREKPPDPKLPTSQKLDPNKTTELVFKRAKVQKLSRAFKTRLDYCLYKTSQGWGKKSFKEVEELYESRNRRRGISHYFSLLDFYPSNYSVPCSPGGYGWASDQFSEPPTPPRVETDSIDPTEMYLTPSSITSKTRGVTASSTDVENEVTKAAKTIMMLQNSPVISKVKIRSSPPHSSSISKESDVENQIHHQIPSTPLSSQVQSPPTPMYFNSDHLSVKSNPAEQSSYDNPSTPIVTVSAAGIGENNRSISCAVSYIKSKSMDEYQLLMDLSKLQKPATFESDPILPRH